MKKTKNPYLPGWEYIPDGEPKLFGDRVYIYGSHDEAEGKSYCTGDYVCWSASKDNLSDWSFEGIIFRRTDDPNYSKEVYLFAPDAVLGPDGRYYLYYFTSEMDKLGVAVCATPAGHYRYYGDVRFPDGTTLTTESGYGLMFDPAIYSGTEGNFLYYGFALQKESSHFTKEGYKGGFVVELENDMLTIKGEPKATIPGKLFADDTEYEGHAFLEASSIRKYNNLYYLVYSSELGHELCYATSTNPMGPFAYRGIIVSNGDVGLNGRTEEDAVNYLGNNHGGMLQIEDDFYIFYHRHTYGAQYSHQGCAEKIVIYEDGYIDQVEITSQGASGIPWEAEGEYSAHLACYLRSRDGILHYSSSVKWKEPHPYIALEGRDKAATLQNAYICNLQEGAVCGFKYLNFRENEQMIGVTYRGDFQGEVEISLDEWNWQPIASIELSSAERWTNASTSLPSISGVHPLFFKFKGVGCCDIDAFSIERRK